MLISEVIAHLETIAPLSLQESHDNAGLLTGQSEWFCTGALCTLDVTEEVITEAIRLKCNLVITHHPIIFSAIKKLTEYSYVGRTVISAIKNDIAIYAIHTNLDNVIEGVNKKMADRVGLSDRSILQPASGTLQKLFTYVPHAHLEIVRTALFEAGCGHIGKYDECSFTSDGSGTFKATPGAIPFVGKIGQRHMEAETKLEVIFPEYLQLSVIKALKQAHPYEEVAYEVIRLENTHPGIGSGLIGSLPQPLEVQHFLSKLKDGFNTGVIRHTSLSKKQIRKVAMCGGAGGFLISRAKRAGADAFVSSDIRYHEFMEAGPDMIICDIGHYESEQFTPDLITEILQEKFPTFAVLKSGIRTNPVHYFN